jgi:hypothetical protein
LKKVRGFVDRLGVALCIASAALCAVLHIATFMTTVSFLWLVPPFFLMFGAVLCAKAVEGDVRFRTPSGKLGWFGLVLLVYAALTFVYFYRTTGGASSVSIVNGGYVSMYKSRIIRTITEQEYRMFPNLWIRVMTAWIAMMSIFGLTQLPSTDRVVDGEA